MPAANPADRALISRIAAHTKWAGTDDRSAATAPARRAFIERFERQVDPDGVLDPIERATRAENARKAHYTRLALRSARSRRLAKELLADAVAAETELSGMEADELP